MRERRQLKMVPWSFPQLAAVADLSRLNVINLADGRYWPKLDTAYKIARALNTTVYDIWGETELLAFIHQMREADEQAMMEKMKDEVEES